MSQKDRQHRPERADYEHALRSMDTFVDISVDDLMALARRAEQFATRRVSEAVTIDRLAHAF